MTEEIWVSIEGLKNYQVSDLGRAKSLDFGDGKGSGNYKRTGRILALSSNGNGYLKIIMGWRGQQKYIHRLVAQAFIPNPENKGEINHINGIKSDNRAKNLEWATSSENKIHAFKIGLRTPPNMKGENNTRCKLNEKLVLEIFDYCKEHTRKETCVKFNITTNMVDSIKSKRTWKHILC